MSNKLCLGTVQLGMKYGIKNELGRQPSCEEAFTLLDSAIQNGIDFFDTASVYGNAEEVLGEFGISRYNVKVVSKLRPHIMNNVAVEREVRESLRLLDISVLDGYLLHDAKDFYRKDIIDGLVRCKEKGLVKYIGVSVYEPEDALNAAKSKMIDYIQIPYNIFDQRLDETDFFEVSLKHNVKIFARSAFLQGLLLMNETNLPPNLQQAIPYLNKLDTIIKRYGYTRVEAALLFAYAHKGIYRIVVGVDTKAQLERNISIINKIVDFELCRQELFGNFKEINSKIICPNQWS